MAIEADLADRSFDLARLVADGRYRFILNLVDHLPRTSHFIEAVAQDDEMAQASAKDVATAKPYAPPVSEFGIAEEILAQVLDRLGALNANLINVNLEKGKPRAKLPKPFPRPETARQRADRIWQRSAYDDAVARLTPGYANDPS